MHWNAGSWEGRKRTFARRMEISAIMIGDLPGESVPRKGESILAEVADRF